VCVCLCRRCAAAVCVCVCVCVCVFVCRVGEKGRGEEGREGERNGVRWVAVGAASVVAMRKQSNTNWSHSRGTAGAQRDSCLGGLRAREKERV